MRIATLVLALALLAPAARAAQAAPMAAPLTNFNVVLLQPSDVLEQRVASVDAMAEYIRQVEAAARDAVVASGAQQAVGGFIVVAVRPGQQAKVWLDFDALIDLEMKRQLVERVGAVKPFEAKDGPVVFALKVATWAGKPSKRSLPAPIEWKRANEGGQPREVGELVERLWNE